MYAIRSYYDSCVKGRFAYGYANHADRILNPMIRDSIDQPWREVV